MDDSNFTIQTDMQKKNDNSLPQNTRSAMMETASFVLGMTAILTSGCIYLAIVCGSLGIIFALLSKGGENTLSRQGKIGLVLSSCGLLFTILIYVGLVVFMLHYYGGAEGILQEYMQIMGVESLEELYQMFGI